MYARVSSRDQKEDLARQILVLEEHATSQHWENTHAIQDIGSGLNTRKPGLKKLISLVLARKVKRHGTKNKVSLVLCADDLLLDICRNFGVVVGILKNEDKDTQTQWC